jgi:hypothetical protein
MTFRRSTAAVALAALTLPAPAAEAYDRTVQATCYDLSGTTASGRPVGPRVAAHNYIPLGTKIRLIGRWAGPTGVRRYVVADTGAPWALGDGHLDLWAPSCLGWPNPTVTWRFGW